MYGLQVDISTDEKKLGGLAMKSRGAQDNYVREEIVREYARTVERLIHSGAWDEVPAPEDQLPDEVMPGSFFEYWQQ